MCNIVWWNINILDIKYRYLRSGFYSKISIFQDHTWIVKNKAWNRRSIPKNIDTPGYGNIDFFQSPILRVDLNGDWEGWEDEDESPGLTLKDGCKRNCICSELIPKCCNNASSINVSSCTCHKPCISKCSSSEYSPNFSDISIYSSMPTCICDCWLSSNRTCFRTPVCEIIGMSSAKLNNACPFELTSSCLGVPETMALDVRQCKMTSISPNSLIPTKTGTFSEGRE